MSRNILVAIIGARYILPYSVIVIAFFFNALVLNGYRFTVKEIFRSLISERSKIPVIIYGAGTTGRAAANVLLESNSHYRLAFFLDDDPKLSQLKILGRTIYEFEEHALENLVKKHKTEVMILAMGQLEGVKKRKIIELCLDKGLIVKEVPSSDSWVGGHLSEKQFREVNIEDLLGRPSIKLGSANALNELGKKTILVTGAAGSIGSEICRQVLNCNVKHLIMLDQAESGLYNAFHSFDPEMREKVTMQIADVTRISSIQQVFEDHRPQIIFHAAAYKHVPLVEDFPLEGIRTNVLGTKILADLSDSFAVEKFVLVSTDKAVNPTNVMGATKRAAELYVQSLNEASHVEFITTRFGNVLGSNGSIIPLITNQIRKGGPVTITHPDITRFFMTIPEACALVLEAAAMGNGGEIFVFDMGESVKILDLAQKMIRLAGMKEGEDIEIDFIGLRPGEKLFEEVLSTTEKTQPTFHPKIMIANVEANEFSKVNDSFKILENQSVAFQEEKAVETLKQLIPEYKSKNSRFTQLDNN